MKVNEEQWNFMQDHLSYTDEEMKIFRENPINEDVLLKTAELMNKTIVIEVIEAHGCNSRHKPGDKFYFDGPGNLLTKLNPKRICASVLGAAAPLIFSSHELFYAGIDPNKMRFKRTGCADVGVKCGGWGNVVMEIKYEDRKKD